MRSITDITVEVEDDYDTHSEIAVSSVVYDATLDEHAGDFGHPTTDQILAAATQVAGVLARVALVAQPWMAYEAQQCRCPQTMIAGKYYDMGHEWSDVCSITFPDVMLRPSSDLGDTPAVWFCVPRASVDVWLERIRGWLTEAVAADQVRAAGEPTPDVTNL